MQRHLYTYKKMILLWNRISRVQDFVGSGSESTDHLFNIDPGVHKTGHYRDNDPTIAQAKNVYGYENVSRAESCPVNSFYGTGERFVGYHFISEHPV